MDLIAWIAVSGTGPHSDREGVWFHKNSKFNFTLFDHSKFMKCSGMKDIFPMRLLYTFTLHCWRAKDVTVLFFMTYELR